MKMLDYHSSHDSERSIEVLDEMRKLILTQQNSSHCFLKITAFSIELILEFLE